MKNIFIYEREQSLCINQTIIGSLKKEKKKKIYINSKIKKTKTTS